jgi:hypothetical protein
MFMSQSEVMCCHFFPFVGRIHKRPIKISICYNSINLECNYNFLKVFNGQSEQLMVGRRYTTTIETADSLSQDCQVVQTAAKSNIPALYAFNTEEFERRLKFGQRALYELF